MTTSAAARFLRCDRRTLQRAIARREGPEREEGTFLRRATWFRAWKVVAWRNRITGNGPTTYADIVASWPALSSFAAAHHVPVKRPSWWPRGERRYCAIRRIKTGFHARLARIDLLLALMEKDTELARRELARELKL